MHARTTSCEPVVTGSDVSETCSAAAPNFHIAVPSRHRSRGVGDGLRMRRYSCAWCTAETVDRWPPVACTVCGEQGDFLFCDVSPSPPLRLRTMRHALSRRLRFVLAARI
jgi:hypothetical protein